MRHVGRLGRTAAAVGHGDRQVGKRSHAPPSAENAPESTRKICQSRGPSSSSAGNVVLVLPRRASLSAGIGFAVPVDTVNRVVPELIRQGRVIQ